MTDENTRQQAEEHYYAALDLVSEGEQERALAEYEKSLSVDPASRKPCMAWPAACRI